MQKLKYRSVTSRAEWDYPNRRHGATRSDDLFGLRTTHLGGCSGRGVCGGSAGGVA